MFADIQQHMKQVERELSRGLDAGTPYLDELTAHIFGAGGKRIRPAMAIYSSLMFGDAGEDVYRAAAALEYLHTATLLHDDVVDEADERRGRRTARRLWNNAASVLVGDYLLAYAFRTLTELRNHQVLEVIAETTMLMARGELLQLANSCEEASESDYLEIIHCKTACLFGAAVRIGGALAGADEAAQLKLYAYGHEVGMTFQMVDDVLDYAEDGGEAIGKSLGADFRERKITLPLSHLLSVASKQEHAEIKGMLNGGEVSEQDFKQVVTWMRVYDVEAYTRSEAAKRVERGLSYLKGLPHKKARGSLEGLAEFVLQRKF